MSPILLILIGGSCAGKTTVEQELLSLGDYRTLLVDTTRSPRAGEQDGVHYNFMSVHDFIIRDHANLVAINSDLAWAYGVSVDELVKAGNLNQVSIYSVINEEPVAELLDWVKISNTPIKTCIVHFDIPLSIRKARLVERGHTEEDINTRLAREDAELKLIKPDLVILDNEDSITKIKNLLKEINGR